jgi:DNA processing protein
MESLGPAPALIDAVAASLLRVPSDTLTARALKELVCEGDWLPRLAVRVGFPPEAGREAVALARRSAAQAIDRGQRDGQRVMSVGEPDYPFLLTQITDPPIVLWIRGDAGLLSRPAVAVVGARGASLAGLAAARTFGRDLAAAGLVVVSGLARGADGAAHEGALEAGGATIAVLGCGADRMYPPEHATLGRRILGSGAIVTELRPGTPPFPYHFPLRNRIISGLSKAVVVIEASEKSGSLITARMAMEQGRDVLVVPGAILTGRYRGSHSLIKDGARLVESVEDVLEEIRWPRPQTPSSSASKVLARSDLERALRPGEPRSVDELAARTGRAAADLLAELSLLEIAGRVAKVAGGGFVRLD